MLAAIIATLLCLPPLARARRTRSVLTDYAGVPSQKDGLPDASVYAARTAMDTFVGTEDGLPVRRRPLHFPEYATNSNDKLPPTRVVRRAGRQRVGRVRRLAASPSTRAVRSASMARLTDCLPQRSDHHRRRGRQPLGGHAERTVLLRGSRWNTGNRHDVAPGPIAASYLTRDRRLLVTAGRSLLVRPGCSATEIPRCTTTSSHREDPFGALLVSDQEDGFRRSCRSPSRSTARARPRAALVRDRRNNVCWHRGSGTLARPLRPASRCSPNVRPH